MASPVPYDSEQLKPSRGWGLFSEDVTSMDGVMLKAVVRYHALILLLGLGVSEELGLMSGRRLSWKMVNLYHLVNLLVKPVSCLEFLSRL